MKKLTIEKPSEHLYTRYPGQNSPQPIFLMLDCESGVLTAETNPEIGNAVTEAVWSGRILRYPLPSPYLSARAIGEIMDAYKAEFERIYNGWQSVLRASWRGELNEAATELSNEIYEKIGEWHVAESDCIEIEE